MSGKPFYGHWIQFYRRFYGAGRSYCLVFWVFVSIPAIYSLQSLRRPTYCPDDRALRRHTPYPSTLGVL
jgi:hypothetical protein